MRYLVPIVVVSIAILALDFYVYRNWRRFAGAHSTGLAWTLPIYRVLMWVMPLSLPLYLNLFRWWEVEPRLARALFFAFWAVYYLPKLPIAMVLLAKDLARLMGWSIQRLRPKADGRHHTSGGLPQSRETVGGRMKASEPDRNNAQAPEFDRASERATQPGRAIERTTDIETVPQDTGASTTRPKRPSGAGISRAEFIRRMGWSAAAVPFVATGYGVFRTLYDFSVHRIDVPIQGLPRAFEGLTIAQLSDLHAGSLFSERPMWEAAAIVNELRPDVIAITGDFVNNNTSEMPRVLPALTALRSDLGVYGCLGNHDHYAETSRLVSQIGTTPIELLVNTHRTLEIDGARLHIIGTDNTGFNQHYADLPRAVEGIDAGVDSAKILLAHDPSFWDSHVRPSHTDIDLMLCGHTHGGQFGFEFGPFRWSLAQLRYKRWAGLYAEPRIGGVGQQWLYVNRGIGTVGPPLRLGIPPEITFLTLRRA